VTMMSLVENTRECASWIFVTQSDIESYDNVRPKNRLTKIDISSANHTNICQARNR